MMKKIFPPFTILCLAIGLLALYTSCVHKTITFDTTPDALSKQMINNPSFTENANGENFCWHARVGLDQYVDNYNLTKDTKWLDAGVKYYDFLIGKMETDYYSNSLGPATDYFIDSILPGLKASKENPVRVVSNFTINYYFRNYPDQVQPFYARYYDLGKYDWDYAILYCNYIHPYQLNNGFWPPMNTIHEIKVDDVVVAAIVERKNKDDYLGSALLSEGMNEQDGDKLEQAMIYLERAVEYNPNNEVARLELGNVYSAFLMFDDARNTMDQLLKIYPDYDKALNLKGYSYLIQAEYTQDFSYINDAIRNINPACFTCLGTMLSLDIPGMEFNSRK